MVDSFKKLTQAVPLRKIDSLIVARAFVEKCVFRYGIQTEVLSENGSQFESKFFEGCDNPSASPKSSPAHTTLRPMVRQKYSTGKSLKYSNYSYAITKNIGMCTLRHLLTRIT